MAVVLLSYPRVKEVKQYFSGILPLLSKVPTQEGVRELEYASTRYHITAAWIAIIFDPVFAITDYFNIPDHWKTLLAIRIFISLTVLSIVLLRKRLNITSYVIVFVPFILISLQNAYVFKFLEIENLLGHNLNCMALLLGAALFVLWHWSYSVIMVVVFFVATALFLSLSPTITVREFFVNGGLLMCVFALFMGILIKTRYDLKLKEIIARLALKESNDKLQAQSEEIKSMNDNLERLVSDRTVELEKKNQVLEEYAFINAHKLRAPVASILGLMNLFLKSDLQEDQRQIANHLRDSTEKLDDVVRSIRESIERADRN